MKKEQEETATKGSEGKDGSEKRQASETCVSLIRFAQSFQGFFTPVHVQVLVLAFGQ